jgi:phosphopentomutase
MGVVYLIIIDGLGVGAQEDAGLYNDFGTNTLGHVSSVSKCFLPNLGELGLGNIIPLDTIPPVFDAKAHWGKMREKSAGKDSTTGHWEIAGVKLDKPFPTYPDGFSEDILATICSITGAKKVLANKPYSGTDVIEKFGVEHLRTGNPIVYTSADSVLQVACHVNVTNLDTLFQWCHRIRTEVMVGDDEVGRVIARPFTGEAGSFSRLSDHRHDFSLIPPNPNLPVHLQKSGIKTYSIGKIIDLFADKGFNHFRRTKSNAEGIAQLLSLMKAIGEGFVFVNFIDTDQLYGHRNDPLGFGNSLEEFDRALPAILASMKNEDMMIITGDHGNDPTTPGTDHTREFVPLLYYNKFDTKFVNLGIRNSFSDISVSVCDYFKITHTFEGESFLFK